MVTHGQCDARPTVTFPAAERHRPLTGIKLYCMMTKSNRLRLWLSSFHPALAAQSEMKRIDAISTILVVFTDHLVVPVEQSVRCVCVWNITSELNDL